jgi:hypothetical protein
VCGSAVVSLHTEVLLISPSPSRQSTRGRLELQPKLSRRYMVNFELSTRLCRLGLPEMELVSGCDVVVEVVSEYTRRRP